MYIYSYCSCYVPKMDHQFQYGVASISRWEGKTSVKPESLSSKKNIKFMV